MGVVIDQANVTRDEMQQAWSRTLSLKKAGENRLIDAFGGRASFWDLPSCPPRPPYTDPSVGHFPTNLTCI